MSVYGYQRATTPNLARFAERANVYHRHYSTANFTTPGTASILTGTYPWAHRAIHLQGTVDEAHAPRNIFNSFSALGYHQLAYSHNLLVMSLLAQFEESLDQFIPTRELCLYDAQLADRFFPEDYTTGFLAEWHALRGNAKSPGTLFISFLHRLLRFAHKRKYSGEYDSRFPRGLPELHNLAFVLEDAVDWLQTQVSVLPQPYFAYVHLLPPHEPYRTRAEFVDRFKDGWQPDTKPPHPLTPKVPPGQLNHERRLYDEYLAYADSEFGRLIDFMEKNGTLENTCVVFTSDHGQSFERGLHGHVTPLLYDPLIHIPLLVKKPRQQKRADFFNVTSSVDLLPTLVKAAGGDLPAWSEGEFLPGFDLAPPAADRSIFALEAKSNPKFSPLDKATWMMIKGDYKIIQYSGFPRLEEKIEVYDLKTDADELVNLAEEDRGVVPDLKRELFDKIQNINRRFPEKEE
jgi:arylsulfatase A-like enzyme